MLKFAILLATVAVCYVQADNQYRLYTRVNREIPVNMSRADSNLPDEFNPVDKTIILIHGHGGSLTHDFNVITRREILARGTYNVIVVDWTRKASGSYSSARSNVEGVALQIREFLRWLSEATPSRSRDEPRLPVDPPPVDIKPEIISLSEVHLVGFGLGAHVAGIASRRLSPSIATAGRITGLDPSGSGWDSRSQRLRKGDAEYVEIIHTDGSGLLANGVGSATGDKDFYANSGSNQPGCFSHSCSHNRAYELFAASMRGHLYGNSCSSMTQMNLNLCRGTRVPMGGTDISKDRSNQILRINTGRIYPF